MILEKISETEVEADSAKSSIAENERLIAKNRATLAMSQGEIAKLREQLVLLGNISEVIPPKKKEHIVQSAEQKCLNGICKGWPAREAGTPGALSWCVVLR
jgi:hypothetical protein